MVEQKPSVPLSLSQSLSTLTTRKARKSSSPGADLGAYPDAIANECRITTSDLWGGD